MRRQVVKKIAPERQVTAKATAFKSSNWGASKVQGPRVNRCFQVVGISEKVGKLTPMYNSFERKHMMNYDDTVKYMMKYIMIYIYI